MENDLSVNVAPVPPSPTQPAVSPVSPTLCTQCHQPVQLDAYFCPNCGKKLNEPPISTSILTQSWIYLLSIFGPPLGLWPGIKYFRNPDPKAKQIGMVAIILTILSTVITLWLTFALLNVYLNTITQSLGGGGLY